MEAQEASVVPVSPWGKVHQSTDVVSLTDIMSEELAKELQNKEEKRCLRALTEGAKQLSIQESSSSSGSDHRNAEMLVREEELAEECEFLAHETASDYGNDHLIAQMLQMQFDEEYDDMLKRTENKFNGSSKVGISYSNYRVIPENLLHDSDEEWEGDDKHREWDNFSSTENVKYKKEGDETDKSPEGDETDKSPVAMSGRRNARRVMEFPPGIKTGDGGNFDMKLSNRVYNSLKVYSHRENSRRNRVHDKSERATAEMSLDPQTRLLLHRLVNQEVLDRVNGVLSTGKEAVVLHADGGAGRNTIVPKECAIKVYKTTLNEFKTRKKYIQDDHRFKARFTKQNPRKIIHMWAEKEMHNLMRMRNCGILCPDVVTLKKHVLVMSFIGEDHKPADKLKEAFLKPAELIEAYNQTLATMKKLYEDAKLVHADLSEYNILWHNKQCWFIDVSQSVQCNHPKAHEFLYRDCNNISNFFTNKGVEDVKSSEELFTYITGLTVTDCDVGEISDVPDFEKKEFPRYGEEKKSFPFEYYWEKSENH